MHYRGVGVALFALCAVGNVAVAQLSGFYVERHNGTTWVAASGFPDRFNTPTPDPGLTSGTSFTIPAIAGVYRVYAVNPSNTDIGRITLQGGPTTITTVLIGLSSNAFINPAAPLDGPACRDFGGITNATAGWLVAQV